MTSPAREGPLSKWTNVMKGWQYRWFVLDDNAGLLSYYTSRDKMMKGARRGCVRLRNAIIGIDDEDDSTFTITVDQKVFHFQARHADERKQWAEALEDTIRRHSQHVATGGKLADFQTFDRRLAEADTCLQLMLQSVAHLQQKSDRISSPVEKEEVNAIVATAREMAESVKKSIVLLQLAKRAVSKSCVAAMASPSESGDDHHVVRAAAASAGGDDANKDVSSVSSMSVEDDKISLASGGDDDPEVVAAATASAAANTDKWVKDAPVNSHGVSPVSVSPLPPQQQQQEAQVAATSEAAAASSAVVTAVTTMVSEEVPPTSYSSSDDETDDFEDAYDAVQENDAIISVKSLPMDDLPLEGSGNTVAAAASAGATALPAATAKRATVAVPYTEFFMAEEGELGEKGGESVDEHKSVIMHLLSQVKLGMDLTKVVLPTFILERRSLLEMYADFFSHPDLFVAIARKPTPAERMIACLRFYLSTFSAGRDSAVAKKPYNPILGETFKCLYSLNKTPAEFTYNDQHTNDGPVPWANENHVAFLAEQVSHHPPVSAFYAEQKAARIQFNGHIWTKSKFLGLSIGVHNIGQGCITLLDHNEQYVINFPNGYGRSILTVPWVELGGDCTITCEKSGYSAYVKFHTKPFYGGKPHRVTGEVYAPGSKKNCFSVEGEWNSSMFCKENGGKSEPFFDAHTCKKYPKYVQVIDGQLATESRRMWKKVTDNLRVNNIDEATDGKRTLEDKQRKDAKDRVESCSTYKPRLFSADSADNWTYHALLSNRG